MSNARTLANIINSNSEIVVPSGGIAFVDLDLSNDSATANEAYVMGQDGYETGSWTPVLDNFTETGTSTPSGVYTKIGRVVYFNCSISTTGTIASTINSSRISGLPFSVSESAIGIQGARANWNNGHHGFVLIFTDEKLYPETFGAQDDIIIISGFYFTS